MKAKEAPFRKKISAGTAAKHVGDSQEMPDVTGKSPTFVMCQCPRTCFQVYLECSAFSFSSASPSYSSASHWWDSNQKLASKGTQER